MRTAFFEVKTFVGVKRAVRISLSSLKCPLRQVRILKILGAFRSWDQEGGIDFLIPWLCFSELRNPQMGPMLLPGWRVL